MASPCPLVVVDTSAAIEILVPEAVCHNQYTRMLQVVRAAGIKVVASELIEPELVEAAYTWDARRVYPRTWRVLRQRGELNRPHARELTILTDWRRLLSAGLHTVIPIADVIDESVQIVHDTGIGSYDAVHLATAARVGAALMTHDRGMIAVAPREMQILSERRTAQ